MEQLLGLLLGWLLGGYYVVARVVTMWLLGGCKSDYYVVTMVTRY